MVLDERARHTSRATHTRERDGTRSLPHLRWGLTLALLAVPAWATSQDGSVGPASPVEFETFFDTLVPGLMEEVHAPGLVLSVVVGDSVYLVKGYGTADLARQQPVDAERHLFRVASITKVFTATAIMQLVEAGQVRLDADVNEYLEAFHIEDPFEEPMTVRALLQHTSGIDDDYVDLVLDSPRDHSPLGEYFTNHVPTRARRPGRVMVYTNRAFMLLGHVIEAVSGMTYEAYIQSRILDPLGMTRSFLELPDSMDGLRARGSAFQDGRLVDVYLPDTNTRPSSDLLTTARDMTAFMRLFLNGGKAVGEAAPVLAPTTVEQMFTDCFRHHPLGTTGRCISFGFSTNDEWTAYSHGGNHPGYKSLMMLIPDRDLGVFWSYSGEDGRLHEPLRAAFVDRFGGGGGPAQNSIRPSFTASGDRTFVAAVPGRYRALRAYESLATIERLMLLLSPAEAAVVAAADGSVTIGERTMIPIDPRGPGGPAWGDPETGAALSFFRDQVDGRVYATLESQAWWRLAWHERNLTHLLWVGTLTTLIAGLLATGAGRLWSRRRKSEERPGPPSPAAASVTLAGCLWLVAILAFLVPTPPGQLDFALGLAPRFKFSLGAAWAAVGITVLACGISGWAWFQRRDGGPSQNPTRWLMLLACGGLALWARYWNIV